MDYRVENGHLAESDGEEEAVRVHRSESAMKRCPEDEDFLTALDRIVADSVQQRMQETSNLPQPDITIPSTLRAKIGRKARFEESA